MKPEVTVGDITLAARPATPETFAPFGRLLGVGDHTRLGRPGHLVVSLSTAEPGPRRLTHLVRYPQARRAIIATGNTPMWLVVLGPGEPPGGPPAAFTVAPETLVVVQAGVWHAGPFVLAPTTLMEMLETKGAADRLDRAPLSDLVGAAAARIVLPDEPGAPAPGFDLAAPNALLLASALAGKLRLACLGFEALEVRESASALGEDLAEVCAGLQGVFGHVTDLAEVPGIGTVRAMFEGLGIPLAPVVPPSEALMAEALKGAPPPATDTLTDALALCMLRTGLLLRAYDAARIGEGVLVRLGSQGERFTDARRKRIRLAERPVLCDAAGPFGSLLGTARRAGITGGTRRALVVLFLPPGQDAAAESALLDGIARTVRTYCAGMAPVRLQVG